MSALPLGSESEQRTPQYSASTDWSFSLVDAITAEDIQAIVDRQHCGIRLVNYCNPQVAASIAAGLIKDQTRTNYKVKWATSKDKDTSPDLFYSRNEAQVSDVDRIGPVSSLIDSYSSRAEYSKDAVHNIRKIREYCAPFLSPVDRLRLELDEILPGGAQITNYGDKGKAFVGVGRVMLSSKEMLHADTARAGCLTCNIYLQLPKSGGGTRVWRYSGDYESSPGSYLFAPGEIPSETPTAHLEPTVGEVVIWNPLNPHMVLPFEGGPRVSIQIWLRIAGSLSDNNLSVSLLN